MSVPEKETPLNHKKSRKGTDKEKLQSYTVGRNPVPVEVGSLAVYPISTGFYIYPNDFFHQQYLQIWLIKYSLPDIIMRV